LISWFHADRARVKTRAGEDELHPPFRSAVIRWSLGKLQPSGVDGGGRLTIFETHFSAHAHGLGAAA